MGVAINRLVSYVEKGVMPLNPVYIPPLTYTTISYEVIKDNRFLKA
jgi:hypothetical protein